jgi:DNA repair protein RecO
MTHNTKAVIIKYQRYKEFDRLYTVYTQNFGKLLLIARGSNKIKSKLAGHLEPCVLSNLMIADGKGFKVLAQARAVEAFARIRQNPQKFKIAAVMLESLDKLMETNQTELKVFDLLVRGLRKVNQFKLDHDLVTQGDQVIYHDIVYHYLLRLLIYLGNAPDLRHQETLKDLLVADIGEDDIMVNKQARGLILEYLWRALDEKRLYTLEEMSNVKCQIKPQCQMSNEKI